MPSTPSFLLSMITLKVIGANEVAVPTHLYKVVLCQSLKKSQKKAIDDAKAKTRRYTRSDFPALPRAPSPNYVTADSQFSSNSLRNIIKQDQDSQRCVLKRLLHFFFLIHLKVIYTDTDRQDIF